MGARGLRGPIVPEVCYCWGDLQPRRVSPVSVSAIVLVRREVPSVIWPESSRASSKLRRVPDDEEWVRLSKGERFIKDYLGVNRGLLLWITAVHCRRGACRAWRC